MVKRNIFLTVFLMLLLCLLMPTSAIAASTADAKSPVSLGEKCALTVTYSHGNIPFKGQSVMLYRVATVSTDFQFRLTSDFSDSKLRLNGIKAGSEWDAIRSTLETYVLVENVKPSMEAITDGEGKVSFENLEVGLYFAMADSAISDGMQYLYESVLISLPNMNSDGSLQYQVAANAKGEALPPISPDETVEFEVIKLWKNDSGKATRPKSIEVEIFRNGKSYKEVTLSEENLWSYRWTAENDGATWKVTERNIPEEYALIVEEKGTSFVLTNVLLEDPPVPPNPPTGDTSNVLLYIILAILSGSLLLILGIIGKRTSK